MNIDLGNEPRTYIQQPLFTVTDSVTTENSQEDPKSHKSITMTTDTTHIHKYYPITIRDVVSITPPAVFYP